MLSCLGIFVDNNLIKYAKLKRNKKVYSIESFNVEVYDDLKETIKRIIKETDSEDIPICTNVSSEIYSYFDVYSELDKNDIENSLQIEFKKLCDSNGLNSDDFISKYTLDFNTEDVEKLKAMYVSISKEYLEYYLSNFEGNKLTSVVPIGMSIANLIEDRDENALIINLEENTELTFFLNKRVSSVEDIKYSLREALLKINEDEMSYKKSISALKTINLFNYEDSKYSDIIIPLMDSICAEARALIDEYDDNIKKVYITGIGATINNIDIYFQDKLKIKCETLKPFFCDTSTTKQPIKDYIEVNSAIALAIDGLQNINKDINFAPRTKLEEIEIDTKITAQEDFEVSEWKDMLKEPFSINEKIFVRLIIFELLFIVVYMITSRSAMGKVMGRKNEINDNLSKTTEQITKMRNDLETISKYNKAFDIALNNSNQDTTYQKGDITNLLVRLMYAIPTRVQLTSIKQLNDGSIELKASTDTEAELDQFVESLKNEKVLDSIEANKSTGETFSITIKGKLLK